MASWSVKESFEILYLAVWIRLYRFYDLLRTIFFYWRNANFRRVDRTFLAAYLFDNPYTISRRYGQAQGVVDAEEYAYGETPLVTMDAIAQRSGITAADTVYELGCGRGRTCFWLRCCIGCQVVGIELIPLFAYKAQKIAERAGIGGVDFRCEDYLNTDLSKATVVYLYASNQDDRVIERLIARFAKLRAGTRIVTVSFALKDYPRSECFKEIDSFDADFIWGDATVYVQIVT